MHLSSDTFLLKPTRENKNNNKKEPFIKWKLSHSLCLVKPRGNKEHISSGDKKIEDPPWRPYFGAKVPRKALLPCRAPRGPVGLGELSSGDSLGCNDPSQTVFLTFLG